jgi:hypothetical protein
VVSTVWGQLRPDQDQRINRPPAQTLAMDPPGSSQWMDPLEPEPEATVLNRYAGRGVSVPAMG